MKKRWRVAVLPGDGTGPEIIKASIPVINNVNELFGIEMRLYKGEAGYNCVKKYGTNLPPKTVALLKRSDCILKGPMTTPEGPGSETSAAVRIRRMFDLYADVRPARSLSALKGAKEGIDFVIVRENTEGMYSGLDFNLSDDAAVTIRLITRQASERIGRFAFELAKRRRKHLTIVHKGNILKHTDWLFRKTIENLKRYYKGVKVDDAHVDAMAQWLIKNPEEYDVIVTENLFGDILSDEAAIVAGGIGVSPSANIGEGYAMFEPVHGSAPKYAGKDKVNPIATILSIKMMYEWMGYDKAGKAIETAVEKALKDGFRTYDIGGTSKCSEVGNAVAKNVLQC